MNRYLREVSYAVRSLSMTPLVTGSAVLALALGIGANAAVFSLLDAVLFRQLPYQEAEQLVLLRESAPSYNLPVIPLSLPDFFDWKGQTKVFSDLAAYRLSHFNVADGDEPERVRGAIVSANFFGLLGGRPYVGRGFTAEEDRPGAAQTVVLSHSFWQRRYGANPDVIGTAVWLDGSVATVIGVMPPEFRFPARVDFWAPLGPYREEMMNRADHSDLWAIGRLAPDRTFEQARAEMQAIAGRLQKSYPDTNAKIESDLLPFSEALRGDVRPTILALFGATMLVLALTYANVVSLLLMRAQARKRIFAIRLALGSTHIDLLRHFVIETTLLTLASATLGLLLAYWFIDLTPALTTIDVFQSVRITLDGRVVLFAVVLAALIVAGLAVILSARSSAWNLKTVLQSGDMKFEGLKGRRVNRLMVVAQFAIALVLLLDATVLTLSLAKLIQPDPGFDAKGLLTGRISLPDKQYPTGDKQVAFFDELLRRSRSLPGVQSVGIVSSLPFGGGASQTAFTSEGRTAAPAEPIVAEILAVSPEYFRTMGIPLLAGRSFTDRDRDGAPAVVLVDELAARRVWGGANPVGRRLKLDASPQSTLPWLEVVGVVGHVRSDILADPGQMQLYVPFFQKPQSFMDVVVRTSTGPATVANSLRWSVLQLDPLQPIDKLVTMEQVLSDSLSRQRLAAMLLVAFAILALILTAIGDYAVLAYAVARRRNEIGIRMAMGARSKDILLWVLKDGLALTVIGVAVGLVLSFVTKSWISQLLYGIGPHEPWVVASAVAVTLLMGLLASYLPARRAARIHPATTLRCE